MPPRSGPRSTRGTAKEAITELSRWKTLVKVRANERIRRSLRSDEAREKKNGDRRKEERRRRGTTTTRRRKSDEKERAAMLEGNRGTTDRVSWKILSRGGVSSVRSSPFRLNRAESADARLTRSCSLRRDQDSPARGARRNTTARYDPLENRTDNREQAGIPRIVYASRYRRFSFSDRS